MSGRLATGLRMSEELTTMPNKDRLRIHHIFVPCFFSTCLWSERLSAFCCWREKTSLFFPTQLVRTRDVFSAETPLIPLERQILALHNNVYTLGSGSDLATAANGDGGDQRSPQRSACQRAEGAAMGSFFFFRCCCAHAHFFRPQNTCED